MPRTTSRGRQNAGFYFKQHSKGTMAEGDGEGGHIKTTGGDPQALWLPPRPLRGRGDLGGQRPWGAAPPGANTP